MPASVKTVDMTNVKDAGRFNPRRKPAGDYRAKIMAVEDHKPESASAANQWLFTIALVSDARATYRYHAQWDPKYAWKTRNLCVAAGVLSPDKKTRIKVDPNKLVGKTIGVTLEDDEYEGKPKSQIVAVFPESELTGDEPTDEADNDTEDEASSDEDEDMDGLDLEDI